MMLKATVTVAALVTCALFLSDRVMGAEACSVRPRERRTIATGWEAPRNGPIRVACFDADSTLRVSRSGAPSANHPRDVILLPLVAEKVRRLSEEGYLIAVLSNQGGVEKGFITLRTADGGLRRVCQLLNEAGAAVHYYDFAERYDDCRKPKAGMALHLQRAVSKRTGRAIDWQHSFMVGDSGWKRDVDVQPDGTPGEDFSNSDRGLAETVRRDLAGGKGFPFHHPRDFFGWVRYGVRNFHKLHQVESFLRDHPEFNPGVNKLDLKR